MRYKKALLSILALAVMAAPSAPAWSQSMSGAAPGKAGEAERPADAVRAVQQALKDKGHYPGPIDGKWNAETQTALKAFQQSSGLEATGQLDPETRAKLGMSGN